MSKDEASTGSEAECEVCYAVHDDEIHEATLRVRRWFCSQVTHRFDDDELLPTSAAS